MAYDYLIVGSGLYGATFARQLTDNGYKCLVIDRRNHIGGNVYTERVEGIDVHVYGAHIFHTSNQTVWQFVNRFAKFNNYINSPIARYKDEVFNLPFNMNTFTKMWKDVFTPDDAKKKIDFQRKEYTNDNPKNLEEQALSLVGKDVYEKLIKGYTEKQWGRDCTELPPFIIKRLPLRWTFDNNYFNDVYQGIPIDGYTKMLESMLDGIEVRLNTDFFDFVKENSNQFAKIVYTGAIDEYFGYKLGKLDFRTVRFETEVLNVENYQGNAVVNYTEKQVPYTRIIEHKHFVKGSQPKTVISREYPLEWTDGSEPYYPINDQKNNSLYLKYRELADQEENVIFGGRLGSYTYYDMDKVIQVALDDAEKELNK